MPARSLRRVEHNEVMRYLAAAEVHFVLSFYLMSKPKRIIDKKVLPEYFDALQTRKKNYELRLNDFDIQDGDILILREWDEKRNIYTGRKLRRSVTYVARFKMSQLFWPLEEIMEKGIQVIALK
jgi:Domain of unknown function (DUF3850)